MEELIDTALGHSCKNFDSFLAVMKAAGVEVKQGKHLAFKIPNGKRIAAPKAKATTKPRMLIDIQAKMQQIQSPGFERWAKTFNLKKMAKTVRSFLICNGTLELTARREGFMRNTGN